MCFLILLKLTDTHEYFLKNAQNNSKVKKFKDIAGKNGSPTEKAPCWSVFEETKHIDCFGIWCLS